MELNEKTEIFRQLKTEEQKLDEKIEYLQRKLADKEKIMKALHEYNDVKDATQVVLGQLANIYGVTVRSLHEKFDLTTDM